MPAVKPAAAPAPPSLAEKNFPSEAAARARTDWYVFVLEELNGLGTMLRFQADPKGPEARGIAGRIRAVLDTLAWDAPAALEQTWAFVEKRLNEPHDAWGPAQVLQALEPDKKRVQTWLHGLQPEARALIESSPVPAGG
jgi:hypothetical protein